MNRRRYLALTGTTVTATLAGCLGDDGDDPESRVEAFVDAVDDGDHETINEMIAADGEMDEWAPEDAAYLEAIDVEMTNLDIDELDEDRVEAAVTIRFEEDGSVLDTDTVVYEMRRIDDQWLFWNSDE